MAQTVLLVLVTIFVLDTVSSRSCGHVDCLPPRLQRAFGVAPRPQQNRSGLVSRRRWWKGPNVCKETKFFTDWDLDAQQNRTLVATSSGNISRSRWHRVNTDRSKNEFIITYRKRKAHRNITRVFIFKCCHGYEREKGKDGCSRAMKLKSLMDTLRDLNSTTEFTKAIDLIGLSSNLTQFNYTIFVPPDGAFNRSALKQNINHTGNVDIEIGMYDLLSSHVVRGIWPVMGRSYIHEAYSPQAEYVLQSLNPAASIRLSSLLQETANCVPLLSESSLATNGVIYRVNSVLPRVRDDTLFDRVRTHPNLTMLLGALNEWNMTDVLKQNGPFTLLAPSNSAFENLTAGLWRSNRCFQNVLRHHMEVLPRFTWCSATLCSLGKVNMYPSNVMSFGIDHRITFSCAPGERLLLDDAQVIIPDVMATNGVMHVIDRVLMPDEGYDVTNMAERLGGTDFVSYLRRAKLMKMVNNLQNVTVLMPNNAAFKRARRSLLKGLRRQQGQLQQLLLYHVVKGLGVERYVTHQSLMAGGKIHFSQQASRVECARVINHNVKFCFGRINVIDKVLVPPSGDVPHVLRKHDKYSKLIQLLTITGLKSVLEEEGPYTLLALTNKAIEKLHIRSNEAWSPGLNHTLHLKQYLQTYVIKGYHCCSYLRRYASYFIKVMFPGARLPIAYCDNRATNGVFHGINNAIHAPPAVLFVN